MYYAFHLCSSQSTAIRFREIKKNTVPSDNDTTEYDWAIACHIPRAPKEKKTGGRGDRRKASAKSRAIVFSYRSEITRLYDNSHKITPLYSCTLTLGRLICQQKHRYIWFNFCMKLKIRFLSPSRKAETARGSFPCCCKRNKSLSSGPFPRFPASDSSQESWRHQTLGRKKTQAHLQNFQLFTHMKGSVQERPGESIIFTEIGCFLSLFSVKRRKGLPCPLGENTVYYFVKYLYTGVACPV